MDRLKNFLVKSFTLSLLISLQISHVSAANILVWEALGSHSTRISVTPLMEALSAKGHDITLLTIFPDEEKSESKIKYVVPKKWQASQGSWEQDHSFFELRKDPLNIPKIYFFELPEGGIEACRMLYDDNEFLTWAKAAKFDLVIVESAWNDCAYGFIHYWKSKSMIYGTSSVFPQHLEPFGIPDESSHVGDMLFGFPSSRKNPMKFWQRFVNAFGTIVYDLTRKWYYMPELERITRKGLGLSEDQLPKFVDIESNLSVVLLSTHYSFGATRSFPPNVIPVGGAVVSKNLKPLPKDMEEFVKTAKNGFIFISFGTVAEFTNFEDGVQKEFIAALAKFPDLKFVWKSAFPIKHTLPNNVFVAKWAPQQTILAHPKIKAFITHAGMGSSLEAIHFAVPTICLPVLADQDPNADIMADRDAGIKLEILTLKTEELRWAIDEILHNQKYRKGMDRLAKVFKDRPQPPVEEAVWWVEYVLRHDNIHEILMPPSVTQPWWKKRQIDVWVTAALLFFIITTVPLYLAYFIIRKLVGVMFKVQKSDKKLKKN